MVILFFLTIVAVLMQRQLLSVAWMTLSLLLAVLASLAVIWVIVDERPYTFIKTWLIRRIPFLAGVMGKIDKVHYAVLEYRDDRQALFIALLNTFLFYFLAVVNVYVTALAFGSEIKFS